MEYSEAEAELARLHKALPKALIRAAREYDRAGDKVSASAVRYALSVVGIVLDGQEALLHEGGQE